MKNISYGLLVCGFVWLLTACGSDLDDTQHVDKARGYLDSGKTQEAAIELKNALRKNPDNVEGRFLLGRVHYEFGNIPTAEKELTRANKLGMANDQVLPLLGRILLELGKVEDIEALSLDGLSVRAQAEVLSVKGLGKLIQGDREGAASLIDQGAKQDPSSPYVQVAKARLLAAKGETQQSRDQLAKAFEIDPEYELGWSLLGDLERQAQNLDLAEQAYTKAIDQRVGNVRDRLNRVVTRIFLKDYDSAQQDIDILKKRFPKHPGVNYFSALVLLQDNKLKEAQEAFELAYIDKDRYPLALYLLGVTNYLQGNLEQAETYTENFVSQYPAYVPARKVLALIKLRNGDYAKVEELIEPIIEFKKEDVFALNLLANAMIKQGKTDRGIELLERVSKLQPESPIAQMRLGTGLLMAGKEDSGVDHIETAIKLNPQFQQADILLVLNYLQKQKFDLAIKTARDYQERNPDSVIPLNLLGRVYLAANQENEAKSAFNKARALSPGDPSANHALAGLALKSKAYGEARAYYQEVLKHHKDHLDTLLGLAAVAKLENNEASMMEYYQRAMKAHPKAIQPRLLLANSYLAEREPDRVSKLFIDIDDALKNDPRVLTVIAQSELAKSEFSAAKITSEKLLKQEPDSAQAHYLIANAYAGLGEKQKMQRELKEALRISPDHFPARLTLARTLLAERNLDAFNEHLVVLKKTAADHPDVLWMEAAVLKSRGDHKQALKLSETIFEKSPTTSSMLNLARQKWGMGDREGAFELQQQWIKDNPHDIPARIALAEAYSKVSKQDAAIDQYHGILRTDKNNHVALNNLAWYLSETQPKKALEYAERLNEAKPNVANYKDTLAVVLMKAGEAEKARRVIDQALLIDTKNSTIRYHSAQIDLANGEELSARKMLMAILEEGGDFPEKEEAEKLLKELQGGG
jgi:putative PEP-CTERM system TPR-repeat lipoprotein